MGDAWDSSGSDSSFALYAYYEQTPSREIFDHRSCGSFSPVDDHMPYGVQQKGSFELDRQHTGNLFQRCASVWCRVCPAYFENGLSSRELSSSEIAQYREVVEKEQKEYQTLFAKTLEQM